MFTDFLRQLKVPTVPTDMSFGISVVVGDIDRKALMRAFISSKHNLTRPWFWRLYFDMFRFNVTCLSSLALLEQQVDSEATQQYP